MMIALIDPTDLLHLAACRNDVAGIERLLSLGQSVDAREPFFHATALHYASQRGNLDAVRSLLNNGANLEAKTNENFTALHLAAQQKRRDICELLLDKGANANAQDWERWTPLHNVCQTAFSAEIVKNMLNKGANINAINSDGKSCLHLIAEKTAAQNSDQSIICQILIGKGCRVDTRDHRNWTALHCAAYDGQLEVCRILIANKADVMALTKKRNAPLHFAVDYGHYKIVELLLDNGADVNAQDCDKWTPLHYAAEKNHTDIAGLLVDVYNADPSLTDDTDRTPLHLAAYYDNFAVAAKLMSYSNRADINAILSDSGATALHLATQMGNLAFVKALLDRGAYYNSVLKSPMSLTPLDLAKKLVRIPVAQLLEQVDEMLTAVAKNNTRKVQSLIDKGAVANARDCKSGKSALHYAVAHGNLELVKYLIFKGARVDLQSRTGVTPLHSALAEKRYEIAATLIKHAAAKLVFEDLIRFLDAKTVGGGETALHLAVKSKQLNIVKLLVKSGARYNSQSRKGSSPADIATGELKNYFKAIDDLFSQALSCNNPQVLAILDKEPTVVNARDNRLGATALYAALEKKCTDVVRTLLKREANVCLVTNKGNTVLHIASLRGNSDIIDDLVSRCPEANKLEFVNFKTYEGKNTALHVATGEHVVRKLIGNGADSGIKNCKGKTAIDVVEAKIV